MSAHQELYATGIPHPAEIVIDECTLSAYVVPEAGLFAVEGHWLHKCADIVETLVRTYQVFPSRLVLKHVSESHWYDILTNESGDVTACVYIGIMHRDYPELREGAVALASGIEAEL